MNTIFDKLRDLMKEEQNPPRDLITLGFWMATKLTLEELDKMSAYGEVDGPPLMVKALVDSGKYFEAGDGFVQLVTALDA